MCGRGRPSGDIYGRSLIPRAGGATYLPVLPLVCLCLGLLWLRPRRVVAGAVAAAFTRGLAVLLALAAATQLG